MSRYKSTILRSQISFYGDTTAKPQIATATIKPTIYHQKWQFSVQLSPILYPFSYFHLLKSTTSQSKQTRSATYHDDVRFTTVDRRIYQICDIIQSRLPNQASRFICLWIRTRLIQFKVYGYNAVLLNILTTRNILVCFFDDETFHSGKHFFFGVKFHPLKLNSTEK